ncbi:MAG: hypothetical protein IJU50_08045 [Lachnospiraceae bacterium]|nr:hypothetical protein [Lachnospiraceae bacterium]
MDMEFEYLAFRKELMDFEKQVEDFEKLIEEAASMEELAELKKWLFGENIRLGEERKKLDAYAEEISKEKAKLVQENELFDKKMQILTRGFDELNMDKKRFAEEKRREEAWLRQEREDLASIGDNVSVFFKGVTNSFLLKKRYRDLLKLFHPDNMGGDHQMVIKINQEYDRLKNDFEFKQRA